MLKAFLCFFLLCGVSGTLLTAPKNPPSVEGNEKEAGKKQGSWWSSISNSISNTVTNTIKGCTAINGYKYNSLDNKECLTEEMIKQNPNFSAIHYWTWCRNNAYLLDENMPKKKKKAAIKARDAACEEIGDIFGYTPDNITKKLFPGAITLLQTRDRLLSTCSPTKASYGYGDKDLPDNANNCLAIGDEGIKSNRLYALAFYKANYCDLLINEKSKNKQLKNILDRLSTEEGKNLKRLCTRVKKNYKEDIEIEDESK